MAGAALALFLIAVGTAPIAVAECARFVKAHRCGQSQRTWGVLVITRGPREPRCRRCEQHPDECICTLLWYAGHW
jgi:hypothetical protein